MMVNRVVFTATVKKEWTPVAHAPKEHVKHVAVVMGDPNRPDQVKPGAAFDEDDLHTIEEFVNALHDVPGREFKHFNNHSTLLRDLQNNIGKFDYVFNLCDNGYYNNASFELHVPALLEILNMPYTGANPQGLAYCYDKALVRDVAREMGVPVPDAFFINVDDDVDQLDIAFPIIVKPNFADNSLGITKKSVCHDLEQLKVALADIRTEFGYNRQVLLEEFLPGKDLSVGIIGNPGDFIVLPVNEDDYSDLPPDLPPICGYEAKWDPTSPYWTGVKSVKAELPEKTVKILEECSKVMFERVECRDYARFDWRLDANGNPKLLEVNPNPGYCWDGHLAKMCKYAGYTYTDMLRLILDAAEKRLGIQ
jgi:D-alanine-D-alanine ligase